MEKGEMKMSWEDIRNMTRDQLGAMPMQGKETADFLYEIVQKIKDLEDGKCPACSEWP